MSESVPALDRRGAGIPFRAVARKTPESNPELPPGCNRGGARKHRADTNRPDTTLRVPARHQEKYFPWLRAPRSNAWWQISATQPLTSSDAAWRDSRSSGATISTRPPNEKFENAVRLSNQGVQLSHHTGHTMIKDRSQFVCARVRRKRRPNVG